MSTRCSGGVLSAALLLGALSASAQVTPIYTNDFESGVGPGWSANAAVFSPASDAAGLPDRRMLGRYSGSEAVMLTLPAAAQPMAAVLSFDLYTIGSWDGNGEAGFGPDSFGVLVAGGPELLNATFSIYPNDTQSYPERIGAHHPMASGSIERAGGYVRYRVTLPFVLGTTATELIFRGAGLQGIHDEYWCLDNLEVATLGGGVPASSDLLAYWSFDQDDTRDDSGHNHHGTITGTGVTPVDGRCSRAMRFDGGSWIEVPGDELGMTTSTERTVSLWIRAASVPHDAGGGDFTANLVSKYRHFNPGGSNYYGSINLLDAADPRGFPGALTPSITGVGTDAFLGSAFGTALNEWHHVVFVWKAGAEQSRIYVDGQRIAQGALTYNGSVSPEPFRIGAVLGAGDQTYVGDMDEVRMWGRALTDTEVFALYGVAMIVAEGSTEFCQGGSVTLTAVPSGPGLSYRWSNDATTPTIEVDEAGSYSVTVTDANSCSATSAALSVTVRPAPVASISASGPTEFCRGGNVMLSASPVGPGIGYLWSTGATTPTILAAASGNYSVSVTASNGCSTTSAAVVVSVNEPPVVSIGTSGPTEFCLGGGVILSASPAGAGMSYLWSTGAITPTVPVTTSGTYSVTVTDANGCSGTSSTVTVAVNEPPVVAIGASGPMEFCRGGSVTLSASPTGPGLTYAWSTGATTPTLLVTASGSYAVTVTDANGCSATSSAVVVTVHQPPVITAAPAVSSVEGSAAPLAVTFQDAEISDLHTAIVSWGDGSPAETVSISESAGTGSLTASHVFAEAGAYAATVTITDLHGCAVVAGVSVTVANALPEVTDVSVPVALVPVGTAVPASATFTDAGLLDTHTALWSWGDGGTSSGTVSEADGSGSISGSHTYSTAGVYTVTLTATDQHGGSGTSSFSYVVVYDASAGFVTGGGWFDSPAGAFAADPAKVGRVQFGFVSRYHSGAAVPQGHTELQFRAADLTFRSTAYDWLVVAGARAQYKGVGRVNNVDGYAFLLTAIDGARPGGGGADRLRMKIWSVASGQVVYDNMLGAPESGNPSTALGGGSIVIHEN